MKYLMMVVCALSVVSLSGCNSLDQRLSECEAHGVDRNICYEQDQANQRQYQQTSATLSSANTMADAYKEGSGDSNKKKHKSKLDKFFGD